MHCSNFETLINFFDSWDNHLTLLNEFLTGLSLEQDLRCSQQERESKF